MSRTARILGSLADGFGSAFALFPAGHIELPGKRLSVEERMHANFARVGARMEAAIGRVRDEREESKKA